MTSTTYMILNNSNMDNDTEFRRSQIERQLNSMEKLFDDDSDCDDCSSSSGESMANDDAEIDFHDGAKAKVLQLWGGGQLSSVAVDATTVSSSTATTIKNERNPVAAVSAQQDTVETLASTDTNKPLGRSSDHGTPNQRPPMATTSRIRKSSSADNMMKKSRTSLRGSLATNTSSSNRTSAATMNESFTLDESLLAQLPTKGMFSRRHGDELSKSEHCAAQVSSPSSSCKSASSSSRPRIAPTRTSSSSSSTRRRRGGGGELSKSEHGSRKSRSGSLSLSDPNNNNNNNDELSHSSEHRRNRTTLLTARKNSSGGDLPTISRHRKTGSGRLSPVRGISASKSSGIETLHAMKRSASRNNNSDDGESDTSTAGSKVRHSIRSSSTTKHNGPRRVKSSCAVIDRMSTSLSRRELVCSSLDAAAAASTTTTVSSNKQNAQWDTTTTSSAQTMNNLDLDRRKHFTGTQNVTTRKRGGDLSSTSEHGTNGSRYRANSRVSRRSGAGAGAGLSQLSTNNSHSGEAQKEQSVSTKMVDGVVSGGGTTGLPGSYYDMKQKYQQSWDAASCLVAVNNERTKYSLRSLTRDKDLDIEAQKHAEAIAQSNGNYVLKINYMGHVFRGKSVNEMHKTAIQSNSPTTTNAKTNILNPDFNVMGVGVATDTNGVIYVCELFHGKFTLCCCTNENS